MRNPLESPSLYFYETGEVGEAAEGIFTVNFGGWYGRGQKVDGGLLIFLQGVSRGAVESDAGCPSSP